MGKYYKAQDQQSFKPDEVTSVPSGQGETMPLTEKYYKYINKVHNDAVAQGKFIQHAHDNPVYNMMCEGRGLKKFTGKFTTKSYAKGGVVGKDVDMAKNAGSRQELRAMFDEGRTDPNLNITKPFEAYDEIIPINRDGHTVGFITPTVTMRGDRTIGNIYITPSYRNRGVGKEAAQEFMKKNPKLVWFTHDTNKASIGLAKSLGLSYAKRGTGSPHTMVFEKAAKLKYLNLVIGERILNNVKS